MVIGLMVQKKDSVHSHGLMVESMKVSMWKTKNMDLVNYNGQMVKDMKEVGKMEPNMVRV